MDTNNRPGLTDQQALLERVMREVVTRVQDAGFVLKGGGALVLLYGGHRHTTDLDFDAEKKSDMTRRIRRAIRAAGVEIDKSTWWSSERAKRTRDSIRYRVHYRGLRDEMQRLQVDTRYRPKPKHRDIAIVDGIRTYKAEALYDQKLAAQRGRRAARDIYDLAFLSKKYGDRLTNAQISKAESITYDMDGLEKTLIHQLRKDRILASLTTAEYLVIEFREAVEEQMRRRKMKIPEQSVPISLPITREVIALRRLLHGEETVRPSESRLLDRAIYRELDRRDSSPAAQQPDWFDR